MLAGEQPSLAVDSVAIRVHRWLAVYAEMTVVLAKAHNAVVGNVAEQHVAPCREVDRALGPAEAGCDPFNGHGAGEGRKTVRPERKFGIGGLQVCIRIAASRKRAEWQRRGRDGRS